MGKLKIGDKVRILDVDEILFGRDYWNNGDVTEVVGFSFGHPVLRSTKEDASGGSMDILPDEFHAIEKVGERGEELPQHEALLERVITLEAKVDELEDRVEFLRLRQRKTSERLTTVVKLDGKAVGEEIAKALTPKPSANDFRKGDD